MRVAVVNTHDIHGGAARAAYRVHRSLNGVGVRSTYYVQNRTLADPSIQDYVPDPSPAAIAAREDRRAARTQRYDAYAATRSADIELFSPAVWNDDPNILLQRPRADVINLHWVARFLDVPRVFDPSAIRTPIVWTLHDMNPFTGGCHYDQGCGKWRQSCGACPLLGSSSAADLSHEILGQKVAALKHWPDEMLHVVAPSRWLLREALASPLFSRFDGTHAPNGIETDVFHPVADRAAARAALGWPADARVVLFVSNHIKLARKGFGQLVRALSLLPDHDRLMLVGVGDSHVLTADLPFKVALAPFIKNDADMAQLYGAADVTAIPSQQDNLPNTILESLSCATPVVAFAVGGIPDVIVDGDTGFLARPGNVGELAVAFSRAFGDPGELAACGRRGRALMERDYALNRLGDRYRAVFEDVIARAHGRPIGVPSSL